MNDWLSQQADALALASDVPVNVLELTDADMATILDIARIAAHEGGDRTNAPLLCYLLGLCRATGKSLDELAELVRSTS